MSCKTAFNFNITDCKINELAFLPKTNCFKHYIQYSFTIKLMKFDPSPNYFILYFQNKVPLGLCKVFFTKHYISLFKVFS